MAEKQQQAQNTEASADERTDVAKMGDAELLQRVTQVHLEVEKAMDAGEVFIGGTK